METLSTTTANESPALRAVRARIAERFGLVPSFFMMARAEPPIVDDTRPGIRPTERERIFEAFTQLDETSTREKGGTGLGLAITKRLVALLDGTIDVHGREEHGSSFVVTLPARRDTAA